MRRLIVAVNVLCLLTGVYYAFHGDAVAGILWAAASTAITMTIIEDIRRPPE